MIKKEFITYWDHETISPASQRVLDRHFFLASGSGKEKRAEMLIPDNIRYLDIIGFMGKKTKITIEEVIE